MNEQAKPNDKIEIKNPTEYIYNRNLKEKQLQYKKRRG